MTLARGQTSSLSVQTVDGHYKCVNVVLPYHCDIAYMVKRPTDHVTKSITNCDHVRLFVLGRLLSKSGQTDPIF